MIESAQQTDILLYIFFNGRLIKPGIEKNNNLRGSFEGNENKNMNNFTVHFLRTRQLSKIHPTGLLMRKDRD